jgi:CheY-like chemotaxis protein
MFQRVRILIADDHDALRGAVRNLFESRPEFEVCGEAKDGAQAVKKSVELRPDVVLLNVSMPIMNGFDAVRQIRVASPRSRIVILFLYRSAIVRRGSKCWCVLLCSHERCRTRVNRGCEATSGAVTGWSFRTKASERVYKSFEEQLQGG